MFGLRGGMVEEFLKTWTLIALWVVWNEPEAA
jgi:hypothetical protein